MTRVNKLLIGKDINRTANCVDGAGLVTIAANIANGEILVLDKDKKILAAGATVADSDVIYICQGINSTYNYTNEAGTAVTGVRKVIFSDPIEAGKVRSYVAKPYAAKSEQVTVLDNTAGTTPVAGTTYLVRIVYKDLFEHPGQFTQTYRHTAVTGAIDIDDVFAGIAAAINRHKGSRVVATLDAGNDQLILTGKAIPERTSSLNDIDEFDQVRFDVAVNRVTSGGDWAAWTGVTIATTEASTGSGTWEQLRDMEKFANAYKGVTDTTTFPVAKPDFATSTDETYDLIVIEHDKSYLSPDNQYVKQAPLTTIIAINTGAAGVNAGTQTANILGSLNSWMASTPGAFTGVAV